MTADLMKDAKGRLCPRHLVKPVDIARDDVVRELITIARRRSEGLAGFKRFIEGEIAAFVDLSAEQYGARLGGRRGNVSLLSYDGCLKVTRQIADRLTFDERLQAAKVLVDECLTQWSEGSDDKIRLIVQDAFQVDTKGRISTERVLGLRRLEIDDEKWRVAMTALSDSIQIESSTSYIRFYERDSVEDEWRCISLDFANVSTASASTEVGHE